MSGSGAKAPSRRTTTDTAPTTSAGSMLGSILVGVMNTLESQGFEIRASGGEVVGGVALAQPYYAAALYSEGRLPDAAASAPCSSVIFASLRDGGALELVSATQEELRAPSSRPGLPRKLAPVLAQIMSPAAVSTYRWARPPGVALFGRRQLDDDALDCCHSAGLPVSPSMVGEHSEELVTQLEVFFKQFRYPEHKAFVLMDWGFIVFAGDVDEAAATFDVDICPSLLDGVCSLSGAPSISNASTLGGLAGALGRIGGLLSRAQSEPAELAFSPPSAGLSALGIPGLGVRPLPPATGVAGSGHLSAVSEPASPMLGALHAARAAFLEQGSGAGALGGGGGGAPGALTATAAMAGSGAAGAGKELAIPDDIRRAPTHKSGQDEQYRVPSFQTGMRPWMAATADLASAIAALYGGIGGEAQQQANAWLNSFTSQPQAWDACLELLDPGRDAEVCFFCANMLLSKVRKEWHRVPIDQQQRMAAIISGKFRGFLAANTPAKLAVQRLGLLLAAVAALSGPQACRDFAADCMAMVTPACSGGGAAQPAGEQQQQLAEYGLSMLSALAEEVANMDGTRRKDLVAATEQQWGQVVAATQQLAAAASATGAASSYGLLHSALQCLHAWLRLSADGISPVRASPGQLAAAHPALLPALAPLLAPSEAQHAAGAGRVQLLATEVLSELLGPGTFGDDSTLERAALEAAVGSILALQPAALAPGDAGAAAARALAGVASAVAERDAELICSGGALPLAQLMLQCMQRPEREVAQAACEYFLMVNTVPVAERHPQMGAPLFGALAEPLLSHCCYPDGFVGWAECVEEDEETFTRFREQSASELLEVVYLMVGPPFLSGLRDAALAAPSWRRAEAALFASRAVGGAARRHALSSDAGPAAAGAREALGGLLSELCTPGGRAAGALAASPFARATAAELVGSHAPWFEAAEGAPLDGALRLLLECLGSDTSRAPAATALRALCSRCSSRLGGAPGAPAALGTLGALAAAAVAPPPAEGAAAGPTEAPFDDRSAVVEGLAQVAAALPRTDAPAAAAALAAPHVARAQSVLAHGGAAAARGGAAAERQLLDTLSEEIRLIASIVRRLDVPPVGFAGGPGAPPGAPQHPALAVLQGCWPLLGAVAESPLCRQEPAVVEAVCEVFNRVLQSARAAAKPLLPTMLGSAADIFAAHHQPACLLTLAAVAEAFGELRGDATAAAAQRAALEGAVAAAAGALSARAAAGAPLSASGDLLRALLAAADAYLVFAQRLLLGGAAGDDDAADAAAPPPVSPGCLDTLVEAAMQAAGLREKEPASAAFGFLSHLIAVLNKAPPGAAAAAAAAANGSGVPPGGGAAAAAAAAYRALAPRVETLIRTLVLAAVDTAPRQLLRPLAGCLYALLNSPALGERAAAALAASLDAIAPPGQDSAAAAASGGGAAGPLARADAEAFGRAALRRPPLPRGRFDALMMDFAAIPRGEGTGDALLAYEL